MSPRTTLALLWWLCALGVSAARGHSVLAVFPSLDRSAHLVYAPLLRELARRGHAVTLVGHYPLPPPLPSSYRHIQLAERPARAALSFGQVVEHAAARVALEGVVAARAGHEECALLADHPDVARLVRTRARFDVALVESINSDCGFALAYNLSVPTVTLIPGALQGWQLARLGVPADPARTPLASLPYGRRPWFLERVLACVLHRVTVWTHYLASQVPDRVLLYSRLGDSLPALETLAANSTVVLLNSHPSVAALSLRPDRLLYIGGIHLSTPRPLSEDLEQFVSSATEGVVYVSLGSTFRDTTLPPPVLQHLLDLFSDLRQRVLWKYDVSAELQARLPANVLAKKWFPQQDVLNHPRVTAFISQCGVLSAWEAVAAGVPLACVPLAGDQHGVAGALHDAGVASVLPFHQLDKKRLRDALEEVLSPRCVARSRLVSQWWHDRAPSALDTAVWWTERVARHGGGGVATGAALLDLPLYQRLQLDVLLFLTLAAAALLYALAKLVSWLCCCCCVRGESEESEQSTAAGRATSSGGKRVKFE